MSFATVAPFSEASLQLTTTAELVTGAWTFSDGVNSVPIGFSAFVSAYGFANNRKIAVISLTLTLAPGSTLNLPLNDAVAVGANVEDLIQLIAPLSNHVVVNPAFLNTILTDGWKHLTGGPIKISTLSILGGQFRLTTGGSAAVPASMSFNFSCIIEPAP